MRIPIREQLGLLVLFCSLLALMVLALATWFQSKDFITNIRLSGLTLTASLKSAQLSSTILLYESQVRSVATRVLIQSALQRYINGNNTNENWVRTQSDLSGALANGNVLVQAKIFPPFENHNGTAMEGLVNVTSDTARKTVQLPYTNENGTDVFLGDPGIGYPPELYPNLTYHNATSTSPYYVTADGRTLVTHGVLFLGPFMVNESMALLSATTAIVNNTSVLDVLGWLTIVIDASMIFDVRNSQEGLGNSGEVLIIGPTTSDNLWHPGISDSNASNLIKNQDVRFILPPASNDSISGRHRSRLGINNSSIPFPVSSFPAVGEAWTKDNNDVNNAGALLDTRNEEGARVSVGYAQTSTPFVDWILLIEESYNEVVAPIHHLRDVVLICVFSVLGGLLVMIFPLAHYSVAPIRQLRAATKKTVEPYQPDDGQSGYTNSTNHLESHANIEEEPPTGAEEKGGGLMGAVSRWTTKTGEKDPSTPYSWRRKTFRIPSKVPDRKHFIFDELTDLTSTFNEMSDELAMQYERLEERVKQRTAELERSKKAAEAANESKTLFIANISHELKTPLNGILGLTTVCMNEEDPSKIRSTLNTIYKSGDLLLHLLTDLLTFSKNEVGQQLSIDEAEFRISDLSTQLMPTFERQAKEAQINLKVKYFGTSDAFGNTVTDTDKLFGPAGTGKVKDMCLWGDKNRILQVLMNFVSNSLKFTPAHGSVTVRIRCLGIVEPPQANRPESARKSSFTSKKSKNSSKKKVRTSETSLVLPNNSEDEQEQRLSNNDLQNRDSKLSINVAGGTTQIARIAERRRSMSPPPLNTKDLQFEFEVEDTGPGIPEDQQKKIFEPFVQGDLGLSKKYGGTGLGLSICAQLASLMGGDISLHSTVGVGSKFTMRLPLRYLSERAPSTASSSGRRSFSKTNSLVGHTLHDDVNGLHRSNSVVSTSDQEERLADVPRIVGFTQPYVAKEANQTSTSSNLLMMRQAESEAAEAGTKVRVLVAEDNKINQEVVLRMLKLEDVYDVTIAKDGQEAFDKVRESMESGRRFHLVFMDVQMPNVDGIQSTKMIRGMGFSAPIVALTAFAEKSNEEECMASGMDYFLSKPIRRPALKQVLRRFGTIPEDPIGELSPQPMNQDQASNSSNGTVIPATITDQNVGDKKGSTSAASSGYTHTSFTGESSSSSAGGGPETPGTYAPMTTKDSYHVKVNGDQEDISPMS